MRIGLVSGLLGGDTNSATNSPDFAIFDWLWRPAELQEALGLLLPAPVCFGSVLRVLDAVAQYFAEVTDTTDDKNQHGDHQDNPEFRHSRSTKHDKSSCGERGAPLLMEF
jgi:hypothetical protein